MSLRSAEPPAGDPPALHWVVAAQRSWCGAQGCQGLLRHAVAGSAWWVASWDVPSEVENATAGCLV